MPRREPNTEPPWRWGMDVAKRRSLKRAKIGLARKIVVLLHRIWIDGTIPVDCCRAGRGTGLIKERWETLVG
jgi:hypothetical protein